MNTRDLHRSINEFKESYQPGTNSVKDQKGDMPANSQIFSKWKNYFSPLLNLHRVSDAKQMEIHTADTLVPQPSPFEDEIANAKLET